MSGKRRNLIEAAKYLLWDLGFEAMSPRKIINESGAGQGSFYHHFSGKADLAATALSEVETEMRGNFDQIFASGKPPLQRLHDYLNLERNGLNGCRLGRLANEKLALQELLRSPLHRYFAHAENKIAETIAQAITNGEIDPTTDPKAIAATLVATVQGGFVLSRIHNDNKHIALATKGVASMLKALEIRP